MYCPKGELCPRLRGRSSELSIGLVASSTFPEKEGSSAALPPQGVVVKIVSVELPPNAGGQGVAGSNPVVPTMKQQVRGLITH